MSVAALNGTKWWHDRARMLEFQRSRDVEQIHRDDRVFAEMAARMDEKDAELARLRAELSLARDAVWERDGVIRGQGETMIRLSRQNTRLRGLLEEASAMLARHRAHLAAAGLALDELTKPNP